MGALTRLYSHDLGREAVDAFKAGNDVLLIPADLDASVEAMVKAVHSGEISEARLNESVLKILEAKASLGLNKIRLDDLDRLSDIVGKPENIAMGQRISDDAITLVRDNNTLLPLKKTGTVKPGLPYQRVEETREGVVLVIFSEDVRTATGRTMARQMRSRIPDANVIYVDPRIASAMSDAVLKAVDQAQSVVAAVFMVPTPGKIPKAVGDNMKNSVALQDASSLLLQNLLDSAGRKTVVVAAGNPYLAQDFPAIQTYMCTFSDETISEISAIKALFGEIPIRGHLPVTIPNVAARGAGIQRPAQNAN
jgi:beta-N-acetylhexosaminidase